MRNVTFAAEALDPIRAELQPLLEQHWALIAQSYSRSTLAPDFDLYEKLEAAGALHIFTVRDAGVMVGYAITLIAPHPHRKDDLASSVGAIYISPKHRRSGVASQFLHYIEDELRELGAQTMDLAVRDHKVVRWLRMSGMRPVETILERSL